MRPIHWHTQAQSVQKELISSDNRWRISLSQTENSESAFFLCNSDLLLTPHGMGASYRDCFEYFIRDCDRFIARLETVRQEAVEHLRRQLTGAHLEIELSTVSLPH